MEELEILKKIGLTEYESKIVLALLRVGPSKVKELYKHCYVPKNKIYESLQSLINKGLIETIPTTPKKYFIKNMNSFDEIIRDKEENLAKLKEELNKLKNIKQNSLPLSTRELIWINYRHQAFVNKIKEALSKTINENLILATKIRNDPIILRLTKNAIKNGALIKMLIPKEKRGYIREWKQIGVKIKFLDENPNITFSTFDDFLCRINLDISDTINDPTIWIESPPFIQLLKDKFNDLWRSSKN